MIDGGSDEGEMREMDFNFSFIHFANQTDFVLSSYLCTVINIVEL